MTRTIPTTVRPAVKRIRSGGASGGPTVVLVHGTMDQCGSFRRVAEHLSTWDRVSYDRRGWASSRRLGSGASLLDHVDDLLGVLDGLDERAVLAGHSLGGLVALSAAAARPNRIRAVMAYEPPVRWLPWWPAEAPWERLVREAPDAESAARELINEVAGMPIAGRRPVAELRADGRALCAEMADPMLSTPMFDPLTLDVPAIIAAGQRSLPHHIEVSKRLAELLPRGRFVEIADAGHPAHVSHPRQFSDLIEAARSS